MTNAMVNDRIIFNNDELLKDEQLDLVSGGIGAEKIVEIVQQVIAVGAAGAEKIQQLVDSHEYDRMSNSQRERAIGNCLANNPAFCAVVAGLTFATFGAGLSIMQIKFRTSGVSSRTRELIEQRIKSR